MKLSEALKLYNIVDIDEINLNDLKKKWRKIMLEIHPDVGGDSSKAAIYNIAYTVICNYFNNKKSNLVYNNVYKAIYNMTLSELELINNGKDISYISCDGSGNMVTINKFNINDYRVIIDIPLEIKFKNNIYNYKLYTVYNIKNEYKVNVNIPDDDIYSTEDIDVGLLGKRIKAKMVYNRIDLRFNLDYCRVSINIERIDKSG